MEQIKESLSVLVLPFGDTLGMILWCVFIGVCISTVSVYRQKLTVGSVLKKLLEKKAFSQEDAILIPEKRLSSSLRKGRERLVVSVEKEGKRYYYLPEENLDKAKGILKSGKTPLWLALLELLALYALLFIIYQVLPLILDGFSNL